MNDTQRAAQLVNDDALGSRGFAYSNLQLGEEERDLHELSPSSSSHKGKQRAYHDSDDPDDHHGGRSSAAWARQSEELGAGLRRNSFSRMEAGGGAAGRRGSNRLSPGGRMSDKAEKERLRVLWWRSAAINLLFILSWYTFSTLISVYNKWMFSEDHYNFPYPLFVTSVHMLVQWTLSAITLYFFRHLRPTTRPSAPDYAGKVAPCGVATGLDIGLSNLSLRTITLSFYTMCKSSSLAFVLLFAFIFHLEVPSWRLAGIILIITSGVILMVSTETQFHLVGMVEVLTASALGGLRWSLTQLLLDKENMGMGNPIATLFWLAPIMGVTLATCSIIFDGWGNVFGQERFFGSFGATVHTMLAILFPGFLAFAMNVTEFGLIQRTSVVTLSVAGIFKEVAVIFLSTIIFHDLLTPINISGLVVTIFGIALYNYLKYRQFTTGEGGGGGGHGGHGGGGGGGRTPRPPQAGAEMDESGEEMYAEGAPMLLRETGGGRWNGGTPLHSSDAPLHSLGDDENDDALSLSSHRSSSTSSSRRSSFSRLDAQAAELLGDFNDDFDVDDTNTNHLHRESATSKAHQHDGDRIEGLEGLLRGSNGGSTERGEEGGVGELVETERRLEEFERELEETGRNQSGKARGSGGVGDLLGRDSN